MSSVNSTHKDRKHKIETERKVDDFETTTGRLIIFNRQNAKERISSQLTVEIKR
jgi:hypothetical protein